MNKYDLFSYANSFVSFLLKNKEIFKNINQIILFGSVSREDFTKKSDIDLFIDLKKPNSKIKEKIETISKLFKKTKIAENWRIKGISNEISLKIGILEKWKNLHRSIITDGYILYGKYKEIPGDLKHKTVIILDVSEKTRNEKVKLWRELYGYKQKVGDKNYVSKGIIEKLNGKKIGKSTIMMPINNTPEIINYLKKNKIKYKIYEIWIEI